MALKKKNLEKENKRITLTSIAPLSPARWHDKHTYLVWGCWAQLNSIFFADHIISNNGYMKHSHTRQRMTHNNNSNKRKQV